MNIQCVINQLIKNIGSHGIACLGLATEVNKLSFKEKTEN